MAVNVVNPSTVPFPVKVCFKNECPFPMNYDSVVYKEGAVAEGQRWPRCVATNVTAETLSVGKTSHAGTGCSGYVIYRMGADSGLETPGDRLRVTIAFCNTDGENKVAVGIDEPAKVYSSMATWGYNPRSETFSIEGTPVIFTFQCTRGDINNVTVTITKA